METASTQGEKGLPVAGTERRPKRLRCEKAEETLRDGGTCKSLTCNGKQDHVT